jgi:hypothetical protein
MNYDVWDLEANISEEKTFPDEVFLPPMSPHHSSYIIHHTYLMRTFLPFFLIVFLFSNCKNKPQAFQQTRAEADLPKDFLEFYQKFHTDSVYQMAHIEWPLKGESGISADTMAKRQLKEWNPEDWRLMHLPDTSMSTLKRSFETVGEIIVVEKMSYPMVGFGFERQFYKEEDGQWRLIFYGENTQMVQ